MKLTAAAVLVGLLWSSCASAAPMLNQGTEPGRIAHIKYAADTVTRVLGAVDHPVLIELSAAEVIEDVAGGGISGWEVQKRGSRLFVRALATATKATMLVTTRSRSYVFDLVPLRPSPKGGVDLRMSKVVFEYDGAASPGSGATSSAAASASSGKRPGLEAMPMAGANHQPYRNASYTMQVVSETVDIRPREAFDDGRFTWLLFPRNQELPAVYKSVPGTEEEVVVNSHMEGDWLVLHAVAPLWNLRLAGSMVGVFNEAYDAMGVGSGTKTVFPGVTRVDQP